MRSAVDPLLDEASPISCQLRATILARLCANIDEP